MLKRSRFVQDCSKLKKRTFVLEMPLNFIFACPGKAAKLSRNVLNCFWILILKCCGHLAGKLFNMFLSEYCFPDCLKVSHVVEVFKNVRKWSIVRNYCSVRLVAMNSKKTFKGEIHWSAREVWHFLRFLVWFQVLMFNCTSSGTCIW